MDDIESTMEMVLPMLVTDVMHHVESQGKHPEEDFTQRLRDALRKVVPKFPAIQNDVWDQKKKEKIVQEVGKVIRL